MLEFQREADWQLKLSKLSTLKGLKLSKMSKPLKSLLLVDICDPFQNMLRERAVGAETFTIDMASRTENILLLDLGLLSQSNMVPTASLVTH